MELRRRSNGPVTIGAPAPVTDTPVLRLRRISKHFGATVALDGASFDLRAGTVHALLGENGAGKTTLMHIAFGMVKPDAGEIEMRGRSLRLRSPADAIAAGIGMVHQHFTLVPAMTVAENLSLGGRGRFSADAAARTVYDIAHRTGFTLHPAARVEELPVGAQQRVEIAKALVRNAGILVLDEPTAVLAPAEVGDLLRWLRSYAASGSSVVLITHRLHEALDVADDVTVLRRGRVVLTGPARDLTPASLTTAMIGTSTAMDASASSHPARRSPEAPPVFRAEQMTLVDDVGRVRLRDATFHIAGGEIVGIAGVEGAGQRELLRALAGRSAVARGTLQRPEVVGFVPEDRHHDAVLLDRSLTENVVLRDGGRRRGILRWQSERERTRALMDAFDVRAADPDAPMRSLSGGNQQKLVLARELTPPTDTLPHAPALAIVAENPTRGLDVRAAADVHARLRAARASGTAVVMYSSDLDEVLSLADRVLVARAGMLQEVPCDRAQVGRAMLGTT